MKEMEHYRTELEHYMKELEHCKMELEHYKMELEHCKKELGHYRMMLVGLHTQLQSQCQTSSQGCRPD